MSTDIRLVRLCRKTIDRACETVEQRKNVKSFFLTDYFDTMYVEKKKTTGSFAEMMGIGTGYSYENETTVQSYTLYCSKEMQKEYEERENYRGNAFDGDSSMKNLGIIYTYISPETLARMDYSSESIWNEKEGMIMKPFLDDIYEAIDSFKDKHKEAVFVARVYVMLSAGDFAVVVRSKTPETIYHMATYLRKREAGVRSGEGVEKFSFVLYKTYTLLAMEADAWKQGEEHKASENKFIVRGCYSNSYWRDQDEIKQYLAEQHRDNAEEQENAAEQNSPNDKDYIKGLQRLNGRYDFSTQITEQEFWELMPDIVRAKQEIAIGRENHQENNAGDAVQYIKHLIENRYLSYINERYLLADACADIGKDVSNVSRKVLLKEELTNGDYSRLFDNNKEKAKQLLELQEKTAEEVQKVKGYRKKIGQYIRMLKKQIIMCQSINELSDVRIYAEILMEQIETVLRTARIYIKVYGNYGNGDGLDLLEESLQRAVTTIDCYAGYIRNNNMQALQTPNYNIESAAGMEKILIGYSEWLWKLTDYYHYENQPKEEKKKFLPVVVPDIHDQEVNVEVLFPEGNAGDWRNEQKAYNECKDYPIRKYFMIIGSTTLEELSNIPVMMTALAHEIAHQFRYERREVRNKALINIMVRKYMEGVATGLADYIETDMGEAGEENTELRRVLTESLCEAYKKCWESGYGSQEEMMRAPLQVFGKLLEDDLQELITAWRSEDGLRNKITGYIKELQYNAVFEGSDYQKQIARLQELYGNWEKYIANPKGKKGIQEDGWWSESDIIEDIINWAFETAWIVAREAVAVSEEEKEEKYKFPVITQNVSYIEEWENVYGSNPSKDVKRIYREFHRFSYWLEGYIAEKMARQNAVMLTDRLLIFEDTFYESMKRKWKDVMEQTEYLYDTGETKRKQADLLQVPTYRFWNRMGRYLGLSQSDRTWFLKYVRKGVVSGNEDGMRLFVKLYREETADLFMCNILHMSPDAYVNLATSLFVRNVGYRKYDIERLFRVLYTKWCCKEGADETADRIQYGKLCCELVQNIYLQFVKIWNAYDEVNQQSAERYQNITWNGQEGEEQDQLLDNIEEIQNTILEFQEELEQKQMTQEEQTILELLRYIMRMYDILWDLVADMEDMVSQLMGQCGIREDLMGGVSQQERLQNEMKNDKSDKEIRTIANIGKAISKELKNIDAFIGLRQNADLNKKCIELLLNLYYSNKLRNAQMNIMRSETNED